MIVEVIVAARLVAAFEPLLDGEIVAAPFREAAGGVTGRNVAFRQIRKARIDAVFEQEGFEQVIPAPPHVGRTR